MPGIWIWPFASLSLASSSTSPKTAFGAAPPYRPECRSRDGPLRFDLGIDQPAQPDAQRRNALGVQRGIGNQRDVGFQLGGIFGDVFRDRFAADFFFAFDQELQIDRQRAVDRAQRFDGLDVHVHLALVVGRAAGVDVAVAQGGLKRRRVPYFQRIGRLNVVMPVAQHGGLAGSVQPVGVNQRMPGGGNDLDVFHARCAQAVGHETRRRGARRRRARAAC